MLKVRNLTESLENKFNFHESLNEGWMPINKISRYHNVADEFQVNDKLEIRNTKTGKIRTFTTNHGGQADDKVTVKTKDGKTTSVAKETLKDEIETLRSENLGKSPFTLTDSLNESFVEEWWGQTDEDPFDFAHDYGLTCKKIGKRNDEILYRFTGNKEDIKQAKKDGYFFSLDYGADEGHSEDLDESLTEDMDRADIVNKWWDQFDKDSGGMHLIHELAKLTNKPEDEIIALNTTNMWKKFPDEGFLGYFSTDDIRKSLYGQVDEALTEDVDMPVDIYEKVFSYVQARIANDGLSNMCPDVASKVPEYNPDWFDEDWVLEDEIGNLVDKLAIKVTDQLCGKYYD